MIHIFSLQGRPQMGGQVGAVAPLAFSGLTIIIIIDDFNVLKTLKNALTILNF